MTPPATSAPAGGRTVTVTPNGPDDGGDFGPRTPGTTTNGFHEAVASRAGKVVIRGAYVISAPTNLVSNLEIAFDGASVILGASVNMFQAGAPDNLRVTGTVSVDGASARGFVGYGFLVVGGSNVVFDWTCRVQGFSANPPHYLIHAVPKEAAGGRGLVLRGSTVTVDSTVLRANDWSDVDVSGVTTPPGGLTKAVPLAPVALLADGAAGPVSNLSVHDCAMDGGGLQQVSGLVRVFGAPGPGNIARVRLANLRTRNMIPIPSRGLADGVDVNHATDVRFDRVVGDRVNNLVSCVASHAVVANCEATDCNGVGILVGDGGSQTENITDITVVDSVAVNCGRGLLGPNRAGMGVASHEGTTTDRVTFQNCRSVDTAGNGQRYGLGINPRGTITNVAWIGGELHGFESPIVSLNGVPVKVRGASGVPDQG